MKNNTFFSSVSYLLGWRRRYKSALVTKFSYSDRVPVKTGGRFPRSEDFPLAVVALLITEVEDMLLLLLSLLSEEAGDGGGDS